MGLLNPKVTEKYFGNAVARPMLRTFDEQIAPRIDQAFAGAGAFTSRKGVVMGRALSDLQTNMASALAQAQMENQRINAQLQAEALNRIATGVQLGVGQRDSSARRALALSAGLQGALSPFQENAQNLASARYSEFQRVDPLASPIMQLALGAIGTPQSQLYTRPNPVGSFLTGGIGTGLAAASLFPGIGMGAVGLGLLGGLGSAFGR